MGPPGHAVDTERKQCAALNICVWELKHNFGCMYELGVQSFPMVITVIYY